MDTNLGRVSPLVVGPRYIKRASAHRAYNMDIMGCMVPRSVDTIQTVQRKQLALLQCDNKSRFKPRLYPCINVQKSASGIAGVMTEVAALDSLRGLECLTENIFGGISVVRCHLTSTQAAQFRNNREEAANDLAVLFAADTAPQPTLSHLMPRAGEHDFFWHNQVCELKGGATLRNAILNDGRKQDLNFYDAYECVSRKGSKTTAASLSDTHMRDAAPWAPSLSGTLGLFEQKTGNSPGFYIVCVSGMPSVGSEVRNVSVCPCVCVGVLLSGCVTAEIACVIVQLIHALKADLMHRVTALDFCQSKEMWFFKNMNQRNRLRLALQAAQCLRVNVAVQHDMYAHAQDTMRTHAVETCGQCTEFFDRALVLERTSNMNLRVEEYAGETRTVDVIRHFKGCVDLAQHAGPVPVYINASEGVVVLAPDIQFRSATGVDNDLCAFPTAADTFTHTLFPVLNITEERAENNDKIRAEVLAHPQFCLDDIVHHSIYTRTVLSNDIMKILDARDCYGFSRFYGVQYAPPLPVLLYPSTHIPFVSTPHTPRAVTVPRARVEPVIPEAERQDHKTHRSIPDCMCTPIHAPQPTVVFDFEDGQQTRCGERVSLAWDDTTISIVQAMTMPPGASIHATYLTPIVEHSSTRAAA